MPKPGKRTGVRGFIPRKSVRKLMRTIDPASVPRTRTRTRAR